MALRLGFKINRLIKLNRSKFSYANHITTFSTQNLKLRYSKSRCTLTPEQVERRLSNNNVNQRAIPISNEKKIKLTEQNDLKSSGCDVSDIPIIPSDLQNTSVTIRRKFAKSSTQNAITQPLRMPRLANPFPDPVKTLPSDTVSDEEKARQMQEQVKMEARYHLQMHQEMLLQQKLQKMSQKQNVQLSNNKVNQQPQQQMNYSFQQPQEMTVQDQQPNFRKPKQYSELQQREPSMGNNHQLTKTPKQFAVNTTEQNADDIKQKRPRNARCRRKAHTRAARYLRHSWYPRGYIRRQMREYSTSYSAALNPDIMSVSDQCDLIMKRLKKLYPEYENLKKPVLIPGSAEEREFLKYILKLIGKLKAEVDQVQRQTAPFPSYSEVKTFKCEPRKQDNNNITNKDITNNIIFNPGSYPRFYSTKKGKSIITLTVQQQVKNRCPKFKLQGLNPNRDNIKKKDLPTKQEAPYPAYSEICDDPCEPEHPEYRLLHPRSAFSAFKPHNKFYTTSASDSKDVEKREAKKKPPCKSPFPPIPQCDYERQAEKNAEKKRKKHCPKKEKKCDASTTVDSIRIISKIKSWLSCYKPEKDNIKVSRSPTDIDGRETYIIDVCEYQEIAAKPAEMDLAAIREQQGREIVEIYQNPQDGSSTTTGKNLFKNVVYQPINCEGSHILEMTDAIPVQARNIPDFVTQSSSNLVPDQRPQERNQTGENAIEVIPPKITDFKVNEFDFKPTESKVNFPKEKFEVKPFEPKIIEKIPNDFKIDQFKTNIEVKPVQSHVNVGIIPKKLTTNKVKDIVAAMPSRINIVREFKTKNCDGKDVKKVQAVTIKTCPTAEPFKLKSRDFKSLNINYNMHSKFSDLRSNDANDTKETKDIKSLNMYNKYIDFKVNDIKESSDESSPLVKRSVPALCSTNPGCRKVTGGCSKKKKKEQPKKKCRFRKKRKLPNCDDVKNKKNKTCMPLAIPGLEDKPEYAMNAPKKTYFKKVPTISNYIDIKEDISVLAKKEPLQEQDIPFKLKPQFWKKR